MAQPAQLDGGRWLGHLTDQEGLGASELRLRGFIRAPEQG